MRLTQDQKDDVVLLVALVIFALCFGGWMLGPLWEHFTGR